MKIILVTQNMNLSGGIERVLSVQANYWSKVKKYEVCIITWDADEQISFYPLDSNVFIRNIKVGVRKKIIDRIPGISFLRYLNQAKELFQVAIKEEKPDVIVSMMQGIDCYFLSSVAGGIPIIGVNHITLKMRLGKFESKFICKVKKQLIFYLKMKLFRQYNAIVALSKTDANNFLKCKFHSFYIPNPLSFDGLSVDFKRSRKKHIIMVGRIDYLKGQDRLLHIWSRLAFNYPDWKLIFVGDGDNINVLMEMIEKMKLQDRVDIIKKSNNIPALLMNASISAFTSRVESFGMVILESFSCGLPVIAYDCENGPRDLIKDGYNGFLIKDNNVEDYCMKLQYLMNSEDVRKQMGKNALSSTSVFSIDNVMNKWDDLFSYVCN